MRLAERVREAMRRGFAVPVALACAVAAIAAAQAADEKLAGAADESAASAAAPPPAARAAHRMRARDPAAEFAKRFDLTPDQQAQLKRVLAGRQAQIRGVWSNPAIDAGDRVGALKAINDKTVAQIRELLTEEQRKDYIQPQAPDGRAKEAQPSVEDWLNATRPRKPESNAPH